LKTFLGGIGLISSNHLDKAKTTRFLGVGIKHDLTFLDITVLLEETSDFLLRETRMNASNKEVGARVDCTIIRRRTAIILWWATMGC
jgi:hypothetical protein